MVPLLAVASITLGMAAPASVRGTCSSSTCGATGGNSLLQRQETVVQAGRLATEGTQNTVCDEASWPDLDHGLVCGECKVLVDRFSSFYKTCRGYCEQVGRSCVGAWEESGDTCTVKEDMTCDETIASSDAICECGAEVSEPQGGTCYGELTHLAVDEGSGVGDVVFTQSAEECKSQCSDNDECMSFSLCPQWNGCWMKDQSFTGVEPTQVLGTCKTYYKKSCDGAALPTPVPTPTPTSTSGSGKIRIASYNIYWWNAFGQNAWKSVHITDNIKDTLQADVLGLQECDDPGLVHDRTGYAEVSPFAGAQGVVAKPGLFTVGDSGKRNIKATGKWGPRYVTWAQLTHEPSGRTFWHFNTHWCVHSGNGRTCNADKRYAGAKNMLNIIREKAGNAPVIITGDFNAAMGEPGPQHFLQNGFSLAITHWVDAVFYSTDHWQLGQTSLGDAAHSDHRPVIAELEF